MSGRQLGMRLGKSYTWMQRRMNGEVSMSAEDMEAIEQSTGISPLFLISGMETENRHPDGSPNGGSRSVVHPPGLEPGTHWLTVEENNVVPLTRVNKNSEEREETAEVISFPTRATDLGEDAK